MKIEVRQALQEDVALCFGLTEEAMRGYVEATWGVWEPSAQQRSHAESFSPSSHWLVFVEGEVSGVVAAIIEPAHVQLLKLYLRAGVRSRGIGSLVVSSLLRAAAIRSLPLRLRVLAANTRAQEFYSRHGFHESARTAERVFMEARPNPSIERTCQGPLRAPCPAAHVKRYTPRHIASNALAALAHMKLAQVRSIAMALPEAVEEPHFTYTSFRVGGKIFATAPPEGEHLHVFLEEEERQIALALEPASVEKLLWGKRVAGLRVTLAGAKPSFVKQLLEQSWSRKAPKRLLAARSSVARQAKS